MAVTIAHVSDTHFGQFDGAGDRGRVVIDHLARFDPLPDVMVMTGDIADHGDVTEYEEARHAFAGWTGPLLMCPGNHDKREPYARVMRSRPSDAPVDEFHDVAGLRFVMLDSLVDAPPGARIDHGHLEATSLHFLDDALAGAERAVVALHHPPATLGLPLMDSIKLRNSDALQSILHRHRNVVAILVGHAHTACATTFAGLPLLIPGGVVSTVTIHGEDLPEITSDLPPAFAVHTILDDGRLVTQWRTLAGDVPSNSR